MHLRFEFLQRPKTKNSKSTEETQKEMSNFLQRILINVVGKEVSAAVRSNPVVKEMAKETAKAEKHAGQAVGNFLYAAALEIAADVKATAQKLSSQNASSSSATAEEPSSKRIEQKDGSDRGGGKR